MFDLLFFMKTVLIKKKKLSSISEHLPSHLSAHKHWTIIQENVLAAIMVAPYAVRSARSRVHFTVARYLR